ncbi:hypothetical protein IF1G_10271 [Cordyceps javanica]|uniref:Uncharacterized protein n=1 Tax=Cordyceps javanica TaxID=43265 RepID=A0A545UNI7_9HYPO|nr:hypothetical protein IF1G_10271 [Cordyceps javanica]TQW02784.1 hypothetical protein IF2G_09666 [Cordyceps javanica]
MEKESSAASHSAEKQTPQLQHASPAMLCWGPQRDAMICTPSAPINSLSGTGETLLLSPWTDPAGGTLASQEPGSEYFFLNEEAAFRPGSDFLSETMRIPHPLAPSPPLDSDLGQMLRGISPAPTERRASQAAEQLSEAFPSPNSGSDTRGGAHLISPPAGNPTPSLAKPSASTALATTSGAGQGGGVDSDAAAERSIAKILILAEEMGFDSFDDLAATYYTATFSEGSLPRYAQSTSRSRRLRSLLTELHASSRTWVGREARGYYEGQMRLLETVCAEELSGIAAGEQQQVDRTQAFITNMIKQLFTHDDAEQLLEKNKSIPSLWTLLSQVAQKINSGAEDSSLAICVFVYLLQVPL